MTRLPAYPLYLATAFISGLALATAFTTNLVYQVEIVGLDAVEDGRPLAVRERHVSGVQECAHASSPRDR